MGNAAIDLLVLGVSHKTAPVGVRERLAVVPEMMESVLGELAALPSVREAALLSTCNRVEIYAAIDRDGDRAAQGLGEALARRAGRDRRWSSARTFMNGATPRRSRTCFGSPAASIRWCWASRRSWGRPSRRTRAPSATAAPARSSTPASRARSGWRGGFGARRRSRAIRSRSARWRSSSCARCSAASNKRQVLVVGAGKMSELAARTLRTHGATLTVTNRTRARADEMSVRYGAAVSDWSELPAALGVADIVIASTGAQRPVLTRGDVAAGPARAPRPSARSCSTSRCRATWSRRRGSSTASTWPTSTICRRSPPSTATSARTRRPRPRRSSRRSSTAS